MKYATLALCPVVVYLLTAFICVDFDISAWAIEARISCVAFSVVAFIAAMTYPGWDE